MGRNSLINTLQEAPLLLSQYSLTCDEMRHIGIPISLKCLVCPAKEVSLGRLVKMGDNWGIDIRFCGKRIRRQISTNKIEAQAYLDLLETKKKLGHTDLGVTELVSSLKELIELLKGSNFLVPQVKEEKCYMSWDSVFNQWIVDYRTQGRSRGTITRHNTAYVALSKTFSPVPIGEITKEMVVEYVRQRSAVRSGKTVKNELETCGHVFDYAIATGLTKINVVNEAKKLKYVSGIINQTNKVGKALTNSELRKIFNELKRCDWAWGIAWVALNTGMRKSEVESLEWSQIDLNKKVITLKAAQTKTKTDRLVYLNDNMLEYFDKNVRGILPWVWYNPVTKKPYRDITHKWMKACWAVGVKCRFHDLRHTFATRAKRSDTFATSKLLGHVNVKTTNIYVHEEAETLLAIANQVGKSVASIASNQLDLVLAEKNH